MYENYVRTTFDNYILMQANLWMAGYPQIFLDNTLGGNSYKLMPSLLFYYHLSKHSLSLSHSCIKYIIYISLYPRINYLNLIQSNYKHLYNINNRMWGRNHMFTTLISLHTIRSTINVQYLRSDLHNQCTL